MTVKLNSMVWLKRAIAIAVLLILGLSSKNLFLWLQGEGANQYQFELTLPASEELSQQQKLPNASAVEKVFVTGFFSDWSSSHPRYEMEQQEQNRWRLTAELPPGDVQYKFVVHLKHSGGHVWIADPRNPNQTSDSHGGFNSVLERADFSFYQFILQALFIGLACYLSLYYLLHYFLTRLLTHKTPLSRKILFGAMVIILASNFLQISYQLHSNKEMVKQGILDSIHMVHLLFASQMDHPFDPQNKALAQQLLTDYFWQAKTRVEANQVSMLQITLSDIAIFDAALQPLWVQNRQQNHELQARRARDSGFSSTDEYYFHGIFGPVVQKAQQPVSTVPYFTGSLSPQAQTIETPETQLARTLLGFNTLLVPFRDESGLVGYYGAAVQVKLYGYLLGRNLLISLFLVLITMVMSYFLLSAVGRLFTDNLYKLTRWTQKINAGNFDSVVTIDTQDELQELAENFDQMQHSLRQSFEKIEQQNTKLNKAAYQDLATGLANRRMLLRDLNYVHSGSLIVLEWVEYEQMTQLLGDDVSLQLIQTILERLRSVLDQYGLVQLYRIAPNQLCVVSSISEPQALTELAQACLDAIGKDALTISRIALNVSMVAGICSALHLFDEAQIQLKRALAALALAKQHSRAIEHYSPELDRDASLQLNLRKVEQIRDAISQNRVLSYYQPIVDCLSGQIKAYECLVRIREPDGSIVPPSEFLDAAKGSGLYQSISQWMLKNCVEQLYLVPCELTVNLSAIDVNNPQSRDYILNLLHDNPLVAERLTLEITETDSIDDYPKMKGFLDKVNALGCQIALDDFGAGYSNFTHLLSLNIDYIKIDGSLIKALDNDVNALQMTRAIVECARALNIKTVAEFVHNEKIHQIVRSLGIDLCQGYYFGAPEVNIR